MTSTTSLYNVMQQTQMTSFDAVVKRMKISVSRTCPNSVKGMKKFQMRKKMKTMRKRMKISVSRTGPNNDKVVKPFQIRMERIYKKKDDLEDDSSTGGDITVPGVSENDEKEKVNENNSPRGGKYNLRPNPTPNYTDEYRY